jgi:hypothetical protein
MPPTNVLRRRAPDRHAATLYPGTAMLVVAAVGICFGLRRRALRRWTAYGVVATALAVVLSFGPLLREGPLGAVLSAPYDFLRAHYPGFRFARNLWRFGALAQVFIAVFAGLGIAACIGSGRRRSRVVLGTLVTMAIIVDVLCTPIPLLDLGHPADAAWVRRLREMPGDTTIVHIPMARDATPEEMEPTARWMTSQMYHGRPIANGYSGYVPGPAAILMQVMPRFPDGDSIRVLRYFGINHVLAGPEWGTAENLERMRRWDGVVVPEETIDGMMLLRIVGAAPEQTARERAVAKGPTSIP